MYFQLWKYVIPQILNKFPSDDFLPKKLKGAMNAIGTKKLFYKN